MSRPLQGRRILVTRPAAQAANLVARIEASGGQAICFPLHVIVPMKDQGDLESVISRLDEFHWAVFNSPNAVAFSVPLILSRCAWPEGLRVAAVGPGTAARLADCGIGDVLFPEQHFDSEALLTLPVLQSEAIGGKRVLIVRGDGGRELLADTLRLRGASVECVACYQREAPVDKGTIMSMLCNNELDAVTLSSSEGLRNLLELLDTDGYQRLLALPVFVPHPRIAAEARRLGLRRVVQTQPDDAGLVAGIGHYDGFDHE